MYWHLLVYFILLVFYFLGGRRVGGADVPYTMYFGIKHYFFFFFCNDIPNILLFVIYEYNSVSFPDEAAAPVTFALCSNLHVLIKILTCKHAFLPLKTEE